MYCRGQLVQLQHDLPILRQAGLGLAAISYDSGAVLREFASRKAISYPLLGDHESKVIRAFGVANRRYGAGALLDLNTEQITDAPGDVPVQGVAYPSVFVIDAAGIVRWRFVSEADELRLTGAAILQRSVGAGARTARPIKENGHVRVLVTASNSEVGLGNRLRIGVELKMAAGVHIYGRDAAHPYHGLAWHMDPSPCWYQTEPAFPVPQRKRMASDEEMQPVYEGDFHVDRELVLKPVLSAADPALFRLFQKQCLDSESRVKARGTLSFQSCDQRQCFPPESIPVAWEFHFVAPDLERSPPELRREFEQ